jgi:predicted LPLAT superfamily acyltransferase
MAQWQGKSKGTPAGYRIFVRILRTVGVYPAYVLLGFVALYYFLFQPTPFGHSCRFFRRRMGYGIIRAIGSVYWSYMMLGQALIDRVAILSGISAAFTSRSNGGDAITHIAKAGKGGILLGAHIGNWEIAGHFISHYDTPVNILIYDAEHEQIKSYLDEVTGRKPFNIIPIQDNLSHIYLMSEALMRGELICMHADRYLAGHKTVAVDFLGEAAHFPLGPFQMIKALKAPYTFVYAIKDGATHYELFARPIKLASDYASVDDMVSDYVQDVEGMVRRYPTQWFNYYDFWAKPVIT